MKKSFYTFEAVEIPKLIKGSQVFEQLYNIYSEIFARNFCIEDFEQYFYKPKPDLIYIVWVKNALGEIVGFSLLNFYKTA